MSNRNYSQRLPVAVGSGTGGIGSQYTSRAAAVLVRDLQYRRRNQEPPATSLEAGPANDTLSQGPGSDVSHLVVRNPDQAVIGAVPAHKKRGHKRSVQFKLSPHAAEFVPEGLKEPSIPAKESLPPFLPMLNKKWAHLADPPTQPVYSPQDVRSANMNAMPAKENSRAPSQKLNYTVEVLSASAFDKNYPRPTQADYDAYLAALPPDQPSSSNRLTRKPQISGFTLPRDQHAETAQSQSVKVEQHRPEAIGPLPSTHSADDCTTQGRNPALSSHCADEYTSQAYPPVPSTHSADDYTTQACNPALSSHCADEYTSQVYPPVPSTHSADEYTSQAYPPVPSTHSADDYTSEACNAAPPNLQGNCPSQSASNLLPTVIRAQADCERWEALGGDDSTSQAYNTAALNSQGNSPTQDPIHNALLRAMKEYKNKGPDNLDHVKASLKNEQDRLDYADSQRAASAKHSEALMTALRSVQSNTTTDARQSEASRQMPLVKRTAMGHPLPHEGFAEFDTPNDTNFMGTCQDFPVPSSGQAASNAMSQALERRRLEDEASDANSVAWFRANSFPCDREQRAVLTELQQREVQQLAGDRARDAGKAKELPKPIGHERAVRAADKAAAAAALANRPVDISSRRTYDLVRNPRAQAQDAMILMSGTIANLRGYADGTHVGSHLAPWGRPAEHAIDNSFAGNKSFLDKDWGSPPARVGRDPRYQQIMTTDGRATYFEDPARGMGRQ